MTSKVTQSLFESLLLHLLSQLPLCSHLFDYSAFGKSLLTFDIFALALILHIDRQAMHLIDLLIAICLV